MTKTVNKTPRLLILDGNHIAYRAYYKFKNLKTMDGKNTAIVFGIPRIIESLIRKMMSPDKVILVFDGGRSDHRKDILPSYKAREQKLGFDRDDFLEQREQAMYAMGNLGLSIVYKRGFEADDLIALIIKKHPNYHKIIVSGDKDFNQLISPDTDVFNVGKNITYNLVNFKKSLGFEPHQTVDYLSLTGDSSDNIPGYPGIGEKRAIDFLSKFGSIRNFLRSTEKFGKTDKILLSEIASRNKKLIDLKYYYRKYLIRMEIPYLDIEISFPKFKRYCAVNETNSFLKPQFFKTFKYLSHE